jgi:GTPase SAR1 family protein
MSTALKLLIVGNSNTGKSCLTLRYVDEKFTASFVPTIGIDFQYVFVLF